MDGIDLQSLSIIIAATSVVIGVAYNIYNMRLQNKSRQAQIYLGLWQRLNSIEMNNAFGILNRTKIGSYEEFVKMLSDEKWSDAFFFVFTTYEAVGVFVHEDLLNIRLFARDAAGVFVRHWRTYGAFIKEHQVKRDSPRFYIETELLYGKMLEFANKNPDFKIKTYY